VLPSVSTVGGHRRFLLESLRQFAAAHGIHLENSGSAIAEPLRVMVVDDDAVFASYIREIILAADPSVRLKIAADGFDAGQLSESLRPQVVAVDLNMPRVDGIELCKRLRASPTTASARIVILSSALTEENIAAARVAGANQWLDKGASRADILNALGFGIPKRAVAT
jgi:CheY-like chemotaxis protein